MTQIWPGCGVAPVPILLSVICKPDAVVIGFPTPWATAVLGAAADMPTNAATRASASRAVACGKARILVLLWDASGERGACVAQPSARSHRFFGSGKRTASRSRAAEAYNLTCSRGRATRFES